ncbi:elongation factor Ts [Patescibacteria group bacterium]|nr:elongation factor Ts [Patescibacteria group bacterium]
MADAKQVMELRSKTNAGMMSCKKALDEANGDMEKAMQILRRNGELKAAQKTAERTTAEGVIVSYVHHNKKMASLLELQCESDFVALNDDFIAFANDLAMHVAAIKPLYVSPEEITEQDLAKQKELFLQELEKENKPDDIKEKILQGKIDKWMQDVCLTKQEFFKDEEQTIEQLVNNKIAVIGEKIVIARFVCWELGVSGGVCK